MTDFIHRRDFMTAILTMPVAVNTPLASTFAVLDPMTKEWVKGKNAVVVYRPELPNADYFAASWQHQGLSVLALQGDMVIQWRQQLRKHYREGKVLIGQGHWDDYFLLKGLAAEERRLVLGRELNETEIAVQGNIFNWLIC
jgi:hypothetical protein